MPEVVDTKPEDLDGALAFYLATKPGELPDLEVAASAAIHWAKGLKAAAFAHDPTAEYRVILIAAKPGSSNWIARLEELREKVENSKANQSAERVKAGWQKVPLIVRVGIGLAVVVPMTAKPTIDYWFGNDGFSETQKQEMEEIYRKVADVPAVKAQRRAIYKEAPRDKTITGVGTGIPTNGKWKPTNLLPANQFAEAEGLFDLQVMNEEVERTIPQTLDVVLVTPRLENARRAWTFRQEGIAGTINGNYILGVTGRVAYTNLIMFDLTNPIYSDANKAREHLEALHWPHGPVCPKCGETERVTRLQGDSTRPGVVMCNACRKPFTVTVGTIFEGSKIPLNKWLLAFRLMAGSKKGFSAHQLHRSLGITYKSAWFMAHRIREAMDGADGHDPLGGGPDSVVEADETYVGGKAKNRAFRKPAAKKVVFALVERDGRARSFHVANVNAKGLRNLIVTNVNRGAHLMTDEATVYTSVGREFSGHSVVNHSAKEYVTTGGFKHSNTAENFFSVFKRGLIGTYHHMSEAHLGRYCREFDFRYNTRTLTDAERTDAAIVGAIGRRLTYRRTDALAA